MSSSTSEPEEQKPNENGRAVLCAKCEHLNQRGVQECHRCGAQLFIACVECGHQNERVRTRCTQCKKHLQKGWADRVADTFSLTHLGITRTKVVLFLFAMLFASMAIRYLVGMEGQASE